MLFFTSLVCAITRNNRILYIDDLKNGLYKIVNGLFLELLILNIFCCFCFSFLH